MTRPSFNPSLRFVATLGAAALLAGAPAAAQVKPNDPKGNQSSPRRPEVRTPDDQAADRAAQLEARRQQLIQQQAERRAARAAAESGNQPGDTRGTFGNQPAGDPNTVVVDTLGATPIDPQGMVLLDFGDQPVDLSAFVDYITRTLQINIVTDEQLSSRQFQFNATQRVPADQLLNLLAAMVEQQGFALTLDPDMGWYQIIPGADIGPNFNGGEFATTRIIPTPLLDPAQADTLVRAQLKPDANIRSTPIQEVGVVVVTGTPRTIETYIEVLKRITEPFTRVEWHRYQLRNVSADFAIQRIMTLIGGGAPARAAAPAGQPNLTTAVGGQILDLGTRLRADHGNSLLFQGTDEEFARLLDLIALVDVVSPLQFKRYLVGADAVDIATTGQAQGLGSVEYQTAGGSGFNSRRTPGGGTLQTPFTQQQGSDSIGSSRFIVDQENGTILYFGTESQQARVQELVAQFAEQAFGRRIEIKHYKLSYADAEVVATLLQELLTDPQQATGTSPFLPQAGTGNQNLSSLRNEINAALGRGADGEAPDGDVSIISLDEVTIVADPDRNQVLVRAPSRQQNELGRIIRQIDQRQPQVYIEAQIVLVTSGHGFDWSIEAEVAPGEFLLFTNFGLSGGGSTETTRRTVPNALNGVTSAMVQSDYVPYIVNALESSSDQSIISAPRVLVNDNATATIQSTRDEPFATTTQNAGTATTAQGGTVSAGTTLTVTPQISSGGFLRLEYQVELSDFDSAAQQPGLSPPTNTESYDAEVTVPSDMTIVVGGLVQRDEGEVETQVPIIGDIPIFGALFKRYEQDYTYRTIFVFLTPRIVYPDNAERMRLITEGPMAAVGVEDEIPDLLPITIPIDSIEVLRQRLLPSNHAGEQVSAAEAGIPE